MIKGDRPTQRDRIVAWHQLTALRLELAALRLMAALLKDGVATFKANFNPNQPRFPRGSGQISGRWRKVGGDTGRAAARKPLIVDIPGRKPTGDGSPRTPPKTRRLQLPKPGIGHNGGPPLEDPPEIPKQRPPTQSLRIAVTRAVTRFAVRAILRGAAGPYGALLMAAEAVYWFYEYYPWVEAYFDPPKTLDELRSNAALGKADGYDIHHIVEQKPALDAGYPRSIVDNPANLARISRLKHWEINSWYGAPNPRFGGLSPRDYLRDRSWQERFEVGLEAMAGVGVLKP